MGKHFLEMEINIFWLGLVIKHQKKVSFLLKDKAKTIFPNNVERRVEI